MKRLIILLVIFVLIAGVLFAEDDFVFKGKIKFGMSMAEVEKLDNVQVQANNLYKITELNGKKALLVYIFHDNKLTRIAYSIFYDYELPADVIRNYKEIVNLLSQKYGNMPIKKIWHGNSPFDNETESFYYGFLTYQASVTVGDVDIWTVLESKQGDMSTNIFYDYLPLEKSREKQRQEAEKNQL